MAGIRRALVLMTIDRYITMAINFAQIALISRLLSPHEIGVSVIGVSVTAISLAVRDFAAVGYLVQKPHITLADKQTSTTLTNIFSLGIALACVAASPFVEAQYGTKGVAIYLCTGAAALVIEGIGNTLLGLMRRDLEFTKVMIVNQTNLIICVVLVCVLAAKGFSFYSFGIAWLVSATCASAMALALKPDFKIFIPNLREWRAVLSFGAYNGSASILNRLYDALPFLLFGRIMGLQATGFYYRALNICQLPDKMFLAGLLQVALPAMSRAAADGRDLKEPYLRGVSQITALYWPGLVMMAILAHPIVNLLLGPQWTSVVPLVQIIALAWTLAYSTDLTWNVLVSLGGIRDHLIRSAIIWPVSGAILVVASFFGPKAAALGLAAAVPFQWLVSFLVVRRRLPMTFGEMFSALGSSLLVTAATAALPLLVIFTLLHGNFDFGLSTALGLGALSAVGWLAMLISLNHPLWTELRHVIDHGVGLLRPQAPRG